MTVITAYGNHAFNLAAIDMHDLVEGLSYVRSATTLRINHGGGDYEVFNGYGFSFDASGFPRSGTVTAYSAYDDGSLALKISGVGGLAAVTVAAAAKTHATADDQALLRSLLVGADQLTGGNLADVINGYGGNDEITGGKGRDVLTGGVGADDFNYRAAGESLAGVNHDRITDFQVGVDDIDLSAIDANGAAAGHTFSYRGTAAFSGVAGQLRWYHAGNNTFVEGDTNGDKVADIQIELTGLKALTAQDFIL